MPSASWLFHKLRSLKREISNKKFNLNKSQTIALKELFQRMCYAKSSDEYDNLFKMFWQVAPESIKDYFPTHWQSLKSEWVVDDKCYTGNFVNTTNNRLESINSKLKSDINFYSSLENFVKGFFTVLNVLRNERDIKAATNFHKTKVCHYAVNSPKEKYFHKLSCQFCCVLDQKS